MLILCNVSINRGIIYYMNGGEQETYKFGILSLFGVFLLGLHLCPRPVMEIEIGLKYTPSFKVLSRLHTTAHARVV